MAVSDEFLAFVIDQLDAPGKATAKKMFGGAGIYLEGVMFGLVADDVFYLKVDDTNRDDFENTGMTPFRPYPEKNKMTMSYYEVPIDVLENKKALCVWAGKAMEVARHSKKKKSK